MGDSARARAFLKAYRETASITKAAQAAKVDRTRHYRWFQASGRYRMAFERAKEEAMQALEDEAIRRAYEGWNEPVFYKGEKCGAIRRYSDGLMMFLLRGGMPAKYRENYKLELAGPAGGPIPVEQQRLQTLNDDELGELLRIARKLASDRTDRGGTEPAAAE